MNIENLKFIADQILSYIEINKDKRIEVPDTPGLRSDLVTSLNPIDGDKPCAFLPSKYPIPKNLLAIFVREWISVKEGKYQYFIFELKFYKNRLIRTISLNVRWSPLEYQANNRGRKALLKYCFYTKHGKLDIENHRIYYSNDPNHIIEEYRNLIIVNPSNRDLNQKVFCEIALQIGIYLYREGIHTRKLYQLFLEVIPDSCNPSLTRNIFQQLIKRFSVPNQSTSFRYYIRNLLKRLNSHIKNIGTQEDLIGYITSENDVINVEMSTRDIYGVNPQTIHTLIRRGKLTIPKDASGKYDWEKGREDIENYKKQMYNRESQRTLAGAISKKHGIDFKSVQRAIQRLKQTEPNLSPKQIKERLKNKGYKT